MVRFFRAFAPIRTTACEHHREHGGLQAEEQGRDEADLSEQGVDDAQRHDRNDAGQHEQDARDEAAGVRCMSQPM